MLTIITRLLKRIIVIALFSRLLLQPTVVEPLEAVGETFEGASLGVEKGWVVLTLRGNPYQMGLQQGVLLRPYVRELIKTELYPSLEEAGISRWDAQYYGRLIASKLPESLRDEIRGIAKGAGLSFEELLIWNLRSDLLALGQDLSFMVRHEPWPVIENSWMLEGSNIEVVQDKRLPWPSPLSARSTPNHGGEGSTGVSLAVWDEATYDHEAWLAGIVGASGAGGERLLLVHREGTGEEPFIGLALPGEVGVRAGINGSEVAFMMTRFATADRSLTGIPPFMLLRQLLGQSKSSEQAVDFLLEANSNDGAIILVADSKEKIPQQIELSARQVQRHKSAEGILIAMGAPLEGSLASSAALIPTTSAEDEAMRGRIGAWLRLNQSFITGQKIQNLLADAKVHQQNSIAMLIWQPGSSELWLAQATQGLSAPASGWEALNIREKLGKEAEK